MLAARAAAHHLGSRLPAGPLAAVAAVAGVRKTKTTAISFAARMEKVGPDDVDEARAPEQPLVTVFGPRGAVHIVPAGDIAVFTLGAFPADERSLRGAIKPFIGVLDAEGMTATEAVERVLDAAVEALAGGPLHKHELTAAISAALPPVLVPPCRGRCPDRHVEDLLFRLAGVAGAFCFHGATEDLVRTDQYLAEPPTFGDRDAARAALVRRYLRAYGPATANGIAGWLNVPPSDVRESLAALGDEVVDAAIDGTKAGCVLRGDVERIESATAARGVRFLPPYDPYLEGRERATLLPDREDQKRVWRSSGVPGVVLVNGEPAGTWRTKTDRRVVRVVVEPFGPALPADIDDLTDEAHVLATALERGRDRDVAVDIRTPTL